MDLADRLEPIRPVVDGLRPAPPWAAAFGDAVAELALDPPRLCWATPAWRVRIAAWPAAELAALVRRTEVAGGRAAQRALLPASAQRAGLAVQWSAVPLQAPGTRVWLRAEPEPQGADAQAMHRHLEDRERLLFTSRSISVGEMASTLAHEINQPIGTVSNVLRGIGARLAQLPVQADGAARIAELQQGLKLALDQALFAGRVIGRIREFTHSRQPRRERLDLAALAHESALLLDWEFARHGVPLALDIAGAAPVTGDPVMLQQVIVNLLRNALDAQRAVPATPRARIALRVQPGAEEHELAIVDRGGGISREAEDQLFVPFVSSKPDGMGLGLKICRSFIELHQGRLWFTRNAAQDGGGCTFHIALRAETA